MLSASVCAHKGTVPAEHSWLKVEGDVIVSAVKTPEDNQKGLIVRFYSISEEETQVNIKLHGEPKSATIVNTLEKETGKAEISGNTVSLTAKPLSLYAVKITF